MFVIRLPNGNLRVPETAIGNDGRVIGNAYVEIGPQDADYARLAAQALTEDEVARRRAQWRDGDEALQREFAGVRPAERRLSLVRLRRRCGPRVEHRA